MKSYSKKYLAALVLGIALTLIFIGCSSDSSMAPEISDHGLVVQSNTGPVTLLEMESTVSASNASLAKGGNGLFTSEKFISAAEGGEVVVGNPRLGFSKVVFQPNDLPQDMAISMTWGGKKFCDGVFAPHGTVFNQPVRVELSYKCAKLKGIDEDQLKIYYFNESTNVWEHIGGTVDKVNKVVVAYLEHFSRYAIVKT